MPDFESKFIYQPYHGFASWDDFFTRQFRPGQRPITAIGDDSVIVNACESAPFKLAHGVKRIDNFWIKGQPYSLRHMFADDPVKEQFVGGTGKYFGDEGTMTTKLVDMDKSIFRTTYKLIKE